MERSEKTGLGIAVGGHVLLFGALSLGWLLSPPPAPPPPPPMDVSMVDDIGLTAQAPQSTVAPTASKAPDTGPAEQAPPPAAAAPAPVPAPPVKQPDTIPPPKPAPKPAPAPKTPAKPTPDKSKTPPKRDAAALSKMMADVQAEGQSADAKGKKQRASLLGDDFRKTLAQGRANTNSDAPQAAAIDAKALAGIVDAIRRQIQPCADRQINPGPGANTIRVVLNLRLNRDGTLASTPTVVRTSGVDDDNGRYARRVVDLGVAAFKGCSPLKLPEEYYATANGGWSNLNYIWQLR
jgi:outer membrane biosynthesis protein TonB